MTGEQKPGGLEVVAWRWTDADARYSSERVATYDPVRYPHVINVQPLTPAEPAEARIPTLRTRRRTADGSSSSTSTATAKPSCGARRLRSSTLSGESVDGSTSSAVPACDRKTLSCGAKCPPPSRSPAPRRKEMGNEPERHLGFTRGRHFG